MVFNEPVTYLSEHPLPMSPGHTLDRAIQYAAAFPYHAQASGILDHPLSRVMTARFYLAQLARLL